MKNTKIYIVVNSKGGVGKSTISHQVLPLAIDDPVIIEIDSSQNSKLENSKLDSYSFSTATLEDALNEVDFSSDDKNIIVDVGADDNTRQFFKQLDTIEDLKDKIVFIIPINHDYEYFKNAEDTYDLIKNFDENAKIFLALNKVRDSDEDKIKQQFAVYFGSDKYNLEDKSQKLKFKKMIVIMENEIVSLLKMKFKKTLKEIEEDIKNIYDNRIELKSAAKKVSKEELREVRANINIAKEALDMIENFKRIVKTAFIEEPNKKSK